MIDERKLHTNLKALAEKHDPNRFAPFANSIDDLLVFLVGIHKLSPSIVANNLSCCSESYIRNRCRSIGIAPLKRGGDRRSNSISSRLTRNLWQTHTAKELAELFNTSPGYIRYLAYIKGYTSQPSESDEASLYTFDL